jgi:tRNA-splicing ligase RtcB
LGSGNHFLEIQVVDKIFDPGKAAAYGLNEGRIAILVHSGSRGFGYQICDDFLKEMTRHAAREEIQLPDRQLVCAAATSDVGRRYLAAMACAANFAWINRQLLMHLTEEALLRFLSVPPQTLGMRLLYDVCHNIAKLEYHEIEGVQTALYVHRKGATRALPPHHPSLPQIFSQTGQPVLIPGTMGTYSYVLSGAQGALRETFASTCHGAGRVLSRSQAVKRAKGRSIRQELEGRGIFVQSRGKKTLMEETPEAYKNVSQVVEVLQKAGLAHKVARLRPLGVVKG